MLYSITFFAANEEDFWPDAKKRKGICYQKAVKYLKKNLGAPKENFATAQVALEQFVEGKLPRTCGPEMFDAAFAYLAGNFEMITPGAFQDINSILHIDEIAVWPLFHRDKPPFKLPRSKQNVNEFGFLSRRTIEEKIADLVSNLPDCKPPGVAFARNECQQARNQFMEMCTSLKLDGLALMGYLSIW
ncbi:MAG: hypothetical protein ABL888_01120 [Pirellulaceae bacterium]